MKFVWGLYKYRDNFAVPDGFNVGFGNCVITFRDSEYAPIFYPTAASTSSTTAPNFPPDMTLDEKKAWCEAQWILMK